MKFATTIKLVAMIFVVLTAVLLILAVTNVISGSETRETVLKLAAVCGIIAAASMALNFLGTTKS